MDNAQEAMIKSLVAVAWADGRMEDEEGEVIEALLDAFELDEEARTEIREYAKTPRTLRDIDVEQLADHDRRLLIQHAVIVTYIDGHQSEEEKELLDQLQARLNLTLNEGSKLREAAETRAKRLLAFLDKSA